VDLEDICQRSRLLTLGLIDFPEFAGCFLFPYDLDPGHAVFPSLCGWDPLKGVVDAGNIRNGFTDPTPAFDALLIDKDRSSDRNVLSVCAACVQQTVPADDLRTRIAQDRKVMVCDFFPYLTSVLHVIHTQGDDLSLPFVEFLLVPRELAQLRHAIRSPVPAIEDQQYPTASKGRQAKVLSRLISQSKVGSRSTLGGLNLRFGQSMDLGSACSS